MSLKTRWAFALLSVSGDTGAKRARDLLLEVTGANPHRGMAAHLLARAEGGRRPRRVGGRCPPPHGDQPGEHIGAHALAQVLEARREWPALIEALEPSRRNR